MSTLVADASLELTLSDSKNIETNIKIKATETSKQFLGFNCVRDDDNDDDDYDDDDEMMMMMVLVVRVVKTTKMTTSFLSKASPNKNQAKWICSHLFERRSREKFFFLTYELTKTENTPVKQK